MKERLDVLLVKRNLAESREKAKAIIMSGNVFVDGEREDKAGKGFVDFIFYPENPADTGLILELKAGHSPEEAIRQISEKQYALRFKGKPGEKERYTGQILGVGISYDKDTKEHHCKIEQL